MSTQKENIDANKVSEAKAMGSKLYKIQQKEQLNALALHDKLFEESRRQLREYRGFVWEGYLEAAGRLSKK